ncbi:Rossmann-like domain-containing protein [Saccharopolyspora tripterygii]
MTALDEMIESALPEADSEVSVGFLTQQGVQHASRQRSYRNHVLSLRVGASVGSCAVEPGEVGEDVVLDCVGEPVRKLLRHPLPAVRIAALDAHLQELRPHHENAETVHLRRGDSLRKSLHRSQHVVDLLPPGVRRVLVIGVVNSLLQRLRERGIDYVACDRKGGSTEWDEQVITEAEPALEGCDAVLSSGMVLGSGTFQTLLDHARTTATPLVFFAQTGSGILPRFLGDGVTAVSAEPYPFFWLDGGPGVLYRYSEVAAP